MVKISIVIVARDEENNLWELLPTLAWADEVIVQVDDRTTDKSAELGKSFGAKVSTVRFTDFAEFKNSAIAKASNKWVFLLDADERISPELQREIEDVVKSGDAAAYEMPFKNYLGGHWLTHGGLYPDYHTRLFQKGLAHYVGAVHERFEIKGSTKRLTGAVLHYTYRDRSQFETKVNFYSSLEKVGKPNFLKASVKALARFVKVYFMLGGFMDGSDGFFNAWQLARYQWRVYSLNK